MSAISCPECGSYAVEQTTETDSSGMAEYCCLDCGHYFVDDAQEPQPQRRGGE